MAFGLVHYVYLMVALLMSVCMLLLIRRYLQQKNKMTLVFTLFILSYLLVGFFYFGRGFFGLNTDESELIYRAGMACTALTPAILAVFMFYPMMAERQGAVAKYIAVLLFVVWVLTLFSMSMLSLGTVIHSYSFDYFDVYYTTFGPIPYIGILGIPIGIALVDALAIIMMYLRESDYFYKMRAMFLLVGWLVVLAGQTLLLEASTLVLGASLTTIGVLLMAATILRRKPT